MLLHRTIDDVRLGGTGRSKSVAPPFAGEFRHLLCDLQLSDLVAEAPDLD